LGAAHAARLSAVAHGQFGQPFRWTKAPKLQPAQMRFSFSEDSLPLLALGWSAPGRDGELVQAVVQAGTSSARARGSAKSYGQEHHLLS
jgi:hypothetical protein